MDVQTLPPSSFLVSGEGYSTGVWEFVCIFFFCIFNGEGAGFISIIVFLFIILDICNLFFYFLLAFMACIYFSLFH